MGWIVAFLWSSIGKKLMMAVTGLSFCGFLVVHLGGNLSIYGGPDTFNSYAEHLHALGPLVTLAELGLLTLALIHIITGLVLFLQNLKARPQRYKVNKSGGGRTIGSRTMPYTGILMLGFIIFHLTNFHFVDKTHTTIWAIVSQAFQQPAYILIYVTFVLVTAVHVSHGFWSAFQTLGANHPKYMPIIRGGSLLFAVVVGAGFGFLPIFLSIAV